MKKITGIVCEFNPFHNGHKYLVDSVRSAFPDNAVVCVMSGDFVQRGSPALFDKYKRAEAAVRCGADLVLELPAVYSCSGAHEFSKASVRILNHIPGFSVLAFGSECGDLSLLKKYADFSGVEDYNSCLKKNIASGISYSKAAGMALSEFASSSDAGLDRGRTGLSGHQSVNWLLPNDILAVEYIRSLSESGSAAVPFPVKRVGAAHDSEDSTPQDCAERNADPQSGIRFASASSLRQKFLRGESVTGFVPPEIAYMYDSCVFFDKECDERFFQLIKLKLFEMTEAELEAVYGVKEGLENRIKAAVLHASGTDDIIRRIKSKRYTYASIARVLVHIILGITKDLYSEMSDAGVCYARPLAMNNAGAAVLKDIKKSNSMPVISDINKLPQLGKSDEKCLKFDMKAADIYGLLCGKTVYESSDRTKRIFVLKKRSE